jgi:hypothetical protein
LAMSGDDVVEKTRILKKTGSNLMIEDRTLR